MFKEGQRVYDLHGAEYFYRESVTDGHYCHEIVVTQVFNYQGDDFDEHEENGELRKLNSVYSNPPKQKINKEIKFLSKEKQKLAAELYVIDSKIRSGNRKIDEVKLRLEKEIRKYPHHRAFLNLINHKDYWIIDTCTFELNRKGDKLPDGYLSFNPTNGCFEGKWNDYDGDSGKWVIFAEKQEAREYVKNNYTTVHDEDASWDSPYYPERVFKILSAFELPIPKDLDDFITNKKDEAKERCRNNLISAVAQAQLNLKNYEKNKK